MVLGIPQRAAGISVVVEVGAHRRPRLGRIHEHEVKCHMRRHRALLQPLKLRSIARRDRAVGAGEDEHPGSSGRTEGPYRRAVEVLDCQLAGWRVRAHHQ